MEITHDEVRRFQEIWRDEFAEAVSEEDARRYIARLDALFLTLARRPRAADASARVDREVDTHK